MKTVVIIPAYNEQDSIQLVLKDIPKDHVDQVLVVDNGSTDATAERAMEGGAKVIREKQRGYGAACLAGIEYARKLDPDVIIFLDADYSDFPDEIPLLLEHIRRGNDMVIGSRMLGNAEPGALLPQARFGNKLAVLLIRLFFGFRYTDLGPFRAIRWQALLDLKMSDTTFGWTVEMQIRAIRMGLRVSEVPVSYRARIGVSKITGTISGTIRAGYKILYTIFKYALS